MASTQEDSQMTQPIEMETDGGSGGTSSEQQETQLIIGSMDGTEQIHTIVASNQQGGDEDGTTTVITADDLGEGQQFTFVQGGQMGVVGEDGSVTITVQAVDDSQQQDGSGNPIEQKVKIMSVTSGQSATEQIAQALAEAVAGTEDDSEMVEGMAHDETGQSQIILEEESMENQEPEVSHEPWNEEGCIVCNKDIKFDDPVQLSKPTNKKVKEFFMEYLAVSDHVQLEAESVFPFCETCAADLEKLMTINRKIEYFHKEFNRLRDEVAKKAVKTYITRSKPEWLEEDLRLEAFGSYFAEGEKPKTHKEQLMEVWKNRYDLIQPGPKGPMMIRSMDSRGRVTVVRLNSNGQPLPPERQLASTVSNLSRVERVAFEDEDSAGLELFKCPECPKTFNAKPLLDYHMKLHTNANKPFKCNVCGKGFAQRGGLVTHSLVHTGAKPYVCQVCKKAFRQKYHLTQHNLIHSGVKPFSCEICHKSFNVKMNLREHMRRHTGDRPYKCPFCTIIGFFRKKMLKEHIIKSHPGEEMPEELLGMEPSYQSESVDGTNATSEEVADGDDDALAESELDAADQVGLTQEEMLDENSMDVKVSVASSMQ